jgi:hypothetical protein
MITRSQLTARTLADGKDADGKKRQLIMFPMKLNLEDRWQALFILVQLQLNKDCFSQIPGLRKEQCSSRYHI